MIDESIPYRPTHCVWELTLTCNMRCLHCGSYAGIPREDELSTERTLRLVDELVDLGLQRITLSGGEPFLRKDWDKIAGRLINKGVDVGVISNGWFIKEKIRKMASLGKWDIVAMSVDGLRMTHDAFRRTPGSYDRIISAFRALKRAGFKTAAITCVSKYNIHELDRIHDVLASVGVDAWQVQPIFVGGRTKEYQDMLLSLPEMMEVAKFIMRKRKVSPIYVFPADGIGYHSRFEPFIRPEGWSGCQAGLYCIGIEANGNIKGCLSLNPEARGDNPFVEGNVKEKSLKEIWFDSKNFLYNRKFDPEKVEGFCKTCKHMETCRCGCTAEAFTSTGGTYSNPYCIYKEVCENGEPGFVTKVPMEDEFRQKLTEYCEKLEKKKRRAQVLTRGNRPFYGKSVFL